MVHIEAKHIGFAITMNIKILVQQAPLVHFRALANDEKL